MNVRLFAWRGLAVAACLAALPAAHATNGYFPHGFGLKAKGMGGAAVAVTDNAFSGINNPAASVWAGNRAEIGVDNGPGGNALGVERSGQRGAHVVSWQRGRDRPAGVRAIRLHTNARNVSAALSRHPALRQTMRNCARG